MNESKLHNNQTQLVEVSEPEVKKKIRQKKEELQLQYEDLLKKLNEVAETSKN